MQPAHAEDIKDNGQKLTIWMPDITQDDYFIQTTINKEDINSINNKIFDLLDLFYLSISLESPGGIEITLEEWDEIKLNLRYFIESISSLDEILTISNIDQLIDDIESNYNNYLNLQSGAGRYTGNVGSDTDWLNSF